MAKADARAGARWQGAAVGVLIGILSLVVTISYVSIVFTGPLAPYREVGLSMALFGSTVYALVGAFACSVPGIWWGNQSAPLVMTAIGVGGVVAAMPGAGGAALFATAVLFIMAATFLSGVALFLLGLARLGPSAKFIPYPVVGGFLAATGVYLVLNGLRLCVPGDVPVPELFEAGVVAEWAPFLIGGAAMLAVARRWSHAIALSAGILVYVAGFYAYLGLSGTTLAAAEARGLLLGAGPKGLAGLAAADLPRFGEADLAAIAGQLPEMLALAGLAILALVMNVSGIELGTRRVFDLNRELRATGLANMASAAGGAFVGFHSASMDQVGRSLLPEPDRATNIAGAAVLGLAFLGALGAVAWLPVGLFALVLVFIGLELVWRWLVLSRAEMPRNDYALVLVILAITLAFDFVTAVLAGIVAASLLFTAAYARVKVIRNRVTGRLRTSPTERPDRDVQALWEHGDETLVFELQGYLFFGTANTLFETVSADFADPDRAPRQLILDFRRVEGMDVSTAFVIGRIADVAQRTGAFVAVSGLPASVGERLAEAGALKGVRRFPALADALGWAEDLVLSEARGGTVEEGAPATAFSRLLDRAEAAGLSLVAERRALAEGEALFRQGDPGDSLAYLSAGRLSAFIGRAEGEPVRVASFLPGAVVGEIAFSNGARRTASVLADEPSEVALVTRASLDAAAARDPEIAAEFHALISKLLSDRLARTTALLHALER